MPQKYAIEEIPLSNIFVPYYYFRDPCQNLQLDSLSASLETAGQVSPIHVRPVTPLEKQQGADKTYMLIEGYRRYQASIRLGRSTITAYIVKYENSPLWPYYKDHPQGMEQLDLLMQFTFDFQQMKHSQSDKNRLLHRLGSSQDAKNSGILGKLGLSSKLVTEPKDKPEDIRAASDELRASLNTAEPTSIPTSISESDTAHGPALHFPEILMEALEAWRIYYRWKYQMHAFRKDMRRLGVSKMAGTELLKSKGLIQQIEGSIARLIGYLDSCLPYCVCPYCNANKGMFCPPENGCRGIGWVTRATWQSAPRTVQQALAPSNRYYISFTGRIMSMPPLEVKP